MYVCVYVCMYVCVYYVCNETSVNTILYSIVYSIRITIHNNSTIVIYILKLPLYNKIYKQRIYIYVCI